MYGSTKMEVFCGGRRAVSGWKGGWREEHRRSGRIIAPSVAQRVETWGVEAPAIIGKIEGIGVECILSKGATSFLQTSDICNGDRHHSIPGYLSALVMSEWSESIQQSNCLCGCNSYKEVDALARS